MNDTVRFISDALATYRLTRLAMEDKITEDVREAVYERFPSGKVAYLLSCPWCLSIWAGAGIFALRKASPQAADVVSGLLAASAITGVIYNKGLDQ